MSTSTNQLAWSDLNVVAVQAGEPVGEVATETQAGRPGQPLALLLDLHTRSPNRTKWTITTRLLGRLTSPCQLVTTLSMVMVGGWLSDDRHDTL